MPVNPDSWQTLELTEGPEEVKQMSGKRELTRQDQRQSVSELKTHRPSTCDILVVTGGAICLMAVLSLVMYAVCAQMHAGPIVWLVLLATIWLPGVSLLVLFPFSRWPETRLERKQIVGEHNNEGRKVPPG